MRDAILGSLLILVVTGCGDEAASEPTQTTEPAACRARTAALAERLSQLPMGESATWLPDGIDLPLVTSAGAFAGGGVTLTRAGGTWRVNGSVTEAPLEALRADTQRMEAIARVSPARSGPWPLAIGLDRQVTIAQLAPVLDGVASLPLEPVLVVARAPAPLSPEPPAWVREALAGKSGHERAAAITAGITRAAGGCEPIASTGSLIRASDPAEAAAVALPAIRDALGACGCDEGVDLDGYEALLVAALERRGPELGSLSLSLAPQAGEATELSFAAAATAADLASALGASAARPVRIVVR